MSVHRWKRRLIICLLGLVTAHAALFWHWHHLILRGGNDFTAFYTAGKTLQSGHAGSLYDLSQQWRLQQVFAPALEIRKGALPYIRPPVEALVFLPLAYLSYPSAFIAWSVIKLCILFSIPFLLRPYLPGVSMFPPHLEAFLWLAFFPIAFDFIQGQDAILLLLIFTLTFVGLQKGAVLPAGICFGLGLFKFHLVLPIAMIFLLRGKIRFVAGFTLTAILFVCLSWRLVGGEGLLNYPRYLWNISRASSGMTFTDSMPNLRGLLTFVIGRNLPSRLLESLSIVLTVAGILFAASIWRANEDVGSASTLGFSIAIVTTIFTAYYSYTYDLSLLVVPLSWVSCRLLKQRASTLFDWIFLASFFILLASPLYLLFLGVSQFFWLALVLPVFLAGLVRELRVSRELRSIQRPETIIHGS